MGGIAGIRNRSPSTYGVRIAPGSTGPIGPTGTGTTGPTGAAGVTGATGSAGLLGNIILGATISNPSGGALNLSINGTGASAGYTAGGNQYTVLLLNQDTTLTLIDGAGAITGTCLIITRTDSSVNTLTILDAGTGAIALLPGSGSIVAYYNGTAWTLLLL